MNPTTVKLAMKAGSKAYDAFREYKDEKAAQAYDLMSEAADRYNDSQASQLVEDTRNEATKLTRIAHDRFSELADKIEDETASLSKRAQKKAAKLSKKAQKTQKKALKKAKKSKVAQTAMELSPIEMPKKKKGSALKNMTFFGLLLSLIAGVVYWFVLREQEQPSTTPPRVEEQNGSKLVHSSVSEDKPADAPKDEAESDKKAEDKAEEEK